MIDVITNIIYKEEKITLFGRINEEECDIELNCLIEGIEVKDFFNSIIYKPPFDLALTDTKANPYAIYGCKFLQSTLSIANRGVMTIKGKFLSLVKEKEVNKKYDIVEWSFYGLEQFFSLESFNTELGDDGYSFKFIKSETIRQEFDLIDGITGEIHSDYTNVLTSPKLYNLSVEQKKVIKLSFKDKVSKEDINRVILKIKSYFEFIIKQELKISSIVYKNENPFDCFDGVLISGLMLQSKTMVKKIREFPFRDTDKKFFSGMKAWMDLYEPYQEVVGIWQKTIYNSNVPKMDRFIWICQAFELLCTINTEIYEKSKQFKAANSANPNLYSFLCATNELYKIADGISVEYFKLVKDVRNKLTHNNPRIIITDNQKENAYQIIEFFFTKTMETLLGIDGIPLSIMIRQD